MIMSAHISIAIHVQMQIYMCVVCHQQIIQQAMPAPYIVCMYLWDIMYKTMKYKTGTIKIAAAAFSLKMKEPNLSYAYCV